ncbi:MAG: ferrous iron transport protein A [Anaerolineales bacterium]
MTTLDQLQPGQVATVGKVSADKALRRRLLDMGLTRGAQIEMVKVAPMGDPLEYKVRDYRLSLRKNEAQAVQVEV